MNSLFRNSPYRTIFAIWLGWVVIMFAYQAFVPARLNLARPDFALDWTPAETRLNSQAGKIYLNEPFLNTHVSWDSEYYLAIATGGYDDPGVGRINANVGSGTGGLSRSYAFFPFYPLVMRILAVPLRLFGMNPIATATLAGVVVSTLGTLAAMISLYELARTELEDAGGLRAAFYLIIFPSGFFLAQVYTEGLFVGLAFSSLALLQRGHRGWAAALAVLATFTRAVGIVLTIPLLMAWVRTAEWRELDLEWRQIYFKGLPWKAIVNVLVALAPVFAFLLWRVSYYGLAFSRVEEQFFGRGLLSFGITFVNWAEAFRTLFGRNSQAAAYYAVEWGGVLLGFTACLYYLRRRPDLAWFGLLVVFLSFTSGPAQGMHRYVLAAPPVFLFLSRLGRNTAFDKVWTVASILLMGIYATLFSFDMWTG